PTRFVYCVFASIMIVLFFRVFAVVIAVGKRPVSFRTRKLSLPALMVLHSVGCGRVSHCRNICEMERPEGLSIARLRAFLHSGVAASRAYDGAMSTFDLLSLRLP